MTVVEDKPFPVPGGNVWPLTVPAYHALGEMGLIPEKTELLYGTVYRKMPKSPLHVFILTRLLELLRAVLPPGYLLRSEGPITIGNSEPEPDISIVPGKPEDFLREHPHTSELAVEVCVTSHEYDRSKLRAYAKAGVKEVWLVLAPEREIEVYSHPSGETFRDRHVLKSGALECKSIPALRIEVAALFPVKA